MKYPVAVWITDNVYSAEVPDLPGVITEADSIAELELSIKDAVSGWVECESEENKQIPLPTSIENYLNNPDYSNCLWLLVDLSDEITDKTERINITIPRRVLNRLDALAKTAGCSRSGLISQMVLSQPSTLPRTITRAKV